jgi:hypothetical protein
MMDFDILWTTDDPNTVNTAREYLQSTASPDAVNSGVTNVYKGKYKHVVLPRVATTNVGAYDSDKRYYWGIAASKYSSLYLGMWERPHMIPPTEGSNAEDVQTDKSQLSLLWETIIEKLRKLQGNLIETICRQTEKSGASTTIIGEPLRGYGIV